MPSAYKGLEILKGMFIHPNGLHQNANPLQAYYSNHVGYLERDFSGEERKQMQVYNSLRKDDERKQAVGIEIELENYNVTNMAEVPLSTQHAVSIAWLEKEDGSLRNRGREFVSRIGLQTSQAQYALEQLEKYLSIGTKNKVQVNDRTGLHIHMDVSSWTYYNLCNILFLYSLVEPMLFKLSGNRSENLFCVPWYKNFTSLGSVIFALKNSAPNAFRGFRWRNYSKYSGLNIACIDSYSTLEFRMHKGTYNSEEIMRWIVTLENLFTLARKTDLLQNIMEFRTNRHPNKYLKLFDQIVPEPLKVALAKDQNQLVMECQEATLTMYRDFVDKSKVASGLKGNLNPIGGIEDIPFAAHPEDNWDRVREARLNDAIVRVRRAQVEERIVFQPDAPIVPPRRPARG